MTVQRMLWQDYYKNNFVKIYRELCELRQNVYIKKTFSKTEFNKLIFVYLKCHEAAIKLMEYFLCYNGLFYYESRKIIRTAYRTGIISDGETWMDTNAFCIAEKNGSNMIFEKKLLNYYKEPYFNIFIDLNNYFEGKLNGI